MLLTMKSNTTTKYYMEEKGLGMKFSSARVDLKRQPITQIKVEVGRDSWANE